MAERYVITLGRECGAGATYIAQHLSKELGIPYYDKDIFLIRVVFWKNFSM